MEFKTQLMDEAAVERTLIRIAHQIVERNDGTDGLCSGYGTDLCRNCGFCMAGEMASVFNFCPDTLLAGFKLRM